MKIVFVSHTAYPFKIGGREHHMHFLAKEMSRENKHEVIIVSANDHTRKIVWKKIDNTYWAVRLPSYAFSFPKNPHQIYHISFVLHKFLKKAAADIIHCYEYGSFFTTYAALFAMANRISYFYTIYGYKLNPFMLRFFGMLHDKSLGRLLLSGSQGNICVSATQYNEIERIAGDINGKIHLYANSIPSKFKQTIFPARRHIRAASRFLEWKSDYMVFMTICRAIPRKGLDTLIDAFSLIVNKYGIDKAKLLIVGPDGGSKKKIIELAEKQRLNDKILFVNDIKYKNIYFFYELSDVCIIPSYYEGVPLVLFEAMHFGKPIIASKIAGITSVVTSSLPVYLFTPQDTDELAELMARIIEKKHNGGFDDFDYSSVIQEFNSEKESRFYEGLYNKCIENSP
ncbi:MAG: glycosyltransferase family 4 protein [Candidatus Omnitrophica bacterium]|nr:glycosyltransferase family 4 protein [Candidatus Omnitrophota bacterium]